MSRPNVLMITCHDIGQHLGCYGVETVHTPNIDALAERGIRFQNFYSTSAVCSPGRGSLHTGRYPQSNGLMGLTHAPWWWTLNESERHTASLLREQGYATTLIGFNHVDPENPDRLGYEEVRSPDRQAEETVAATMDLIQRAAESDRPFFAKVGFTEVHRPFRHGEDTERGVFVPGWMQDTSQVREDFAQYVPDIKRDNLSRAVITDRYHLIRYFDQGRSIAYPVDMDLKAYTAQTRRCPAKDRCRPFVQLFDLQSDPYELHNLAQDPDQQVRVASLSARLRAWMEEVDDPLLAGPLRTPYYERAMADFLTTGAHL